MQQIFIELLFWIKQCAVCFTVADKIARISTFTKYTVKSGANKEDDIGKLFK